MVEIVNVGTRALKPLRYMLVTDPDADPADGAFPTLNRFVDRRTVQAIAGGQTMTLTTEAGSAGRASLTVKRCLSPTVAKFGCRPLTAFG